MTSRVDRVSLDQCQLRFVLTYNSPDWFCRRHITSFRFLTSQFDSRNLAATEVFGSFEGDCTIRVDNSIDTFSITEFGNVVVIVSAFVGRDSQYSVDIADLRFADR